MAEEFGQPHSLVSSLGFLVLFENLVLIYFGSDAVGYPSPLAGRAFV